MAASSGVRRRRHAVNCSILAVRGPARDDLLIAADRALFGVDVTVWMQRFVRPGLTTFFFLSYTTYYFLALALGAA